MGDCVGQLGQINFNLLVVSVALAGEVVAYVLHPAGAVFQIAIEDKVSRPRGFPAVSQKKRRGVQVEIAAGVKTVDVPAQAHHDPGQARRVLGQADFLPLFQTDWHAASSLRYFNSIMSAQGR